MTDGIDRSFPDVALDALRCPICEAPLHVTRPGLACPAGHAFDRARQGYVNLRAGTATPLNADSAAMIAARARIHEGPVLAPLRRRTAELAETYGVSVGAGTGNPPRTEATPGRRRAPAEATPLVVDLACGTGSYLAAVLDRMPGATGIGIDLSAAALRRAARCHPRAVAVGADLRASLPLCDGAACVALSIFGPRPAGEIRRILRPGGALIVLAPTPAHLAELVAPLGMVHVHPGKREHLARQLAAFREKHRETISYTVPVDHPTARALAEMGPSARHITAEALEARVERLPSRMTITVCVTAHVYAA